MPTPNISELKKALIAEGFEVYRTVGEQVVLAERVRDNLIMDSNVAAGVKGGLRVRFTLRAQANDFPGESEVQLFDRARRLAAESQERGYEELDSNVVTIRDPGDSTRTLDTWYEVAFTKAVTTLPELFDELRFALALDKTATRA
jgi:hypothetical protein